MEKNSKSGVPGALLLFSPPDFQQYKDIMDYILLSLIAKKGFSILEFERMKKLVNRFLELEFVDNKSIFWDENGDLIFHPPIHKRDKGYWINTLNSQIDNEDWEFISGKLI